MSLLSPIYRPMQGALAIGLLLAGLLAVFPAFAAEVEVRVSDASSNALEARSNALKNAEKLGFEQLIRRQAGSKAEDILAAYQAVDFTPYIRGYSTKDEAVTDTSYRARVILDFDDAFINNVLTQGGVDTGRTLRSVNPEVPEGSATLAIGLMQRLDKQYLWEEDNLLRQAINKAVLQLASGRIVVPYGDPTDKLTFSASQGGVVNYARLIPLLRRYGASEVLLITANPSHKGGFDVTTRFLSAKEDVSETQYFPLTEKPRYSERNFTPIAEAIISRELRNIQWQEARSNGGDAAAAALPPTQIEAILTAREAGAWADLRKRLGNIAMIDDINLHTIGSEGMTLHLSYRGDAQDLGIALQEQSITVQKQGDKLALQLR